jgi:hypothetical protein
LFGGWGSPSFQKPKGKELIYVISFFEVLLLERKEKGRAERYVSAGGKDDRYS